MVETVENLSSRYPLWLCDIWGVVHNGRESFAEAADALAQHRKAGGTVILVTNSPRPEAGVVEQLHALGTPPSAYDGVVTSGDVTRDLLRDHGGGKVFLIGPPRDLMILEGLSIDIVPLAEAKAVLITGLNDDETETPEQYVAVLKEIKACNLNVICANPDKIVRRGDKLIYCAGSLADIYAEMGGEVLMAGKPFAPIYNLSLKTAEKISGRSFSKSEILAIGDGPETDVRGAVNFGVAVLLITGGIHDTSLSLAEAEARVRTALPQAQIPLTLKTLSWG